MVQNLEQPVQKCWSIFGDEIVVCGAMMERRSARFKKLLDEFGYSPRANEKIVECYFPKIRGKAEPLNKRKKHV